MKNSNKLSSRVVKDTRCFVVNDKGDVVIQAGDFKELLSKECKGPITHILVGYHYDNPKYYLGVYPIENVYFCEMERR